MTNTQAQQVLGTMLMRYDLTDAELEAIGMAGEALEAEERHKGEEALYKGFEAGLNGTFPEDEWIPVEMGLPEDGEIVMTYRPKTHGEHKMITEHFVRYLNGKTAWLGDTPERGSVTHWRRLPDAPGKEEEHETEEQH